MGEDNFKYVLIIIIVFAAFLILNFDNFFRPKMTLKEKAQLSKIIEQQNADLPCEIGTIGYFDSISFSNDTITCYLKIKGGDEYMQLYLDNYDEFKDMMKYSILKLNGQRNMGTSFAHYLDDKGLNLCIRVYSEDNRVCVSWNHTGRDLKNFIDSCRLSPTAALRKVIDMQIKIANLTLPLTADDVKQTSGVYLNSLIGENIDKSCLLQSVKQVDSDVIFEYRVYENHLKTYEEMQNNQFDLNFMNAFAEILAEDEDMLEFMEALAISRSNLVVIFRGDKSNKCAEIKVPYSIIRKHCKIPSELLYNH